MEEETKEARIHPWVYFIAPLGDNMYFTAFCKACRTYFLERISIDMEYKLQSSNLPRYGCNPISEDVGLLS